MVLDTEDTYFETTLYGLVSGVISVITTHPLDTLKVRWQTDTTQYFHRKIYAGSLPTLASFPLNWTICVTCYSAILKSINGKTTLDHTLAGTVTGLLYGFVMSPFELVKCQAQVRHESSPVVIQQMIYEKGISSLRRGIGIAMFRDVIGISSYFGSYHYFSEMLKEKNFNETMKIMISGGLAGSTAWALIYPIDAIKSRWQTDFSLLSLRETFGTNQPKLFKGFFFAQGRAIVSNSITWLVIEKTKAFVKSQKSYWNYGFN